MKRVLLTGASSGIGAALLKLLVNNDYFVYGIGRNFDDFTHDNFKPIVLDLMDTDALVKCVDGIKKEGPIDLLINNAGVGYYGTHETLSVNSLKELTTINLLTPMVLSNLLLKDMKTNRGTIINISSVTARLVNTHGAAYGATKAALTSFGTSLFDEARKHNVKVINVHPDMTDTNLYRNANFKASDDLDAHLEAEEVAKMIFDLLSLPEHLLVSDITIKPQKHKIEKK